MSARILVAEDDSSVRSFVLRALTLRGHDVTTVSDGLQALEVLGTDAFDLLITDIVMPGLDGIALALRVRREYPGLPILMMAGYSAERQKAHNLEQLIARVVLKPFTLQQICHAVDECLGQARVAASAATDPPAP